MKKSKQKEKGWKHLKATYKRVKGLHETKLYNSYSFNMKTFPKLSLFRLLVPLLCSVLIIVLQIFALSWLFKIKLVNYSLSQKYLLVSLCLTELCSGISIFLGPLGMLVVFADNFHKYLHTFQLTTLYFMYFFVMIILTLDRYFEFRFSIKYSLIWSSKKTLIVLSMF